MSGPTQMVWEISHRCDPRAREIADRHYNRQSIGHPNFVPPGRCLVLYTPGAFWVSSWPFAEYVKHRWGGAWVCSAFRNEDRAAYRSSDLIVQALAVTRYYWGEPPSLGMVTFVDESKTRRKRDPGRCFRKAGFKPDGRTQGGLVALRLDPQDFPQPEAARMQQLVLEAS